MLVIGHRGAAGHAPENTLASIRKAIGFGVDLVEIDVQATRDGQLVVFHDKLLDRVTGATGYLWDFDLARLRAEVRVAGEQIPLLSEVCELVRDSSVRLMVEILDPATAKAVLATVSEILPADQFLVASFHHDTVRELVAQHPGLEAIALVEGAPVDPVRMARDCGAHCVGLGFESIQPEKVAALQEASISVFAWTVNDPREIERARRLGVDGIISDYPDRVAR
ncbi:glycerophosphodiester phosphodiesterase [Amycolatopsis sp. cg13]|uniref:glycerophosphodiester phosphodiesterase n=1 Tax=Amycolatopsis sp. cg13 TaxID=3238807 RepID=UPI00352559C8